MTSTSPCGSSLCLGYASLGHILHCEQFVGNPKPKNLDSNSNKYILSISGFLVKASKSRVFSQSFDTAHGSTQRCRDDPEQTYLALWPPSPTTGSLRCTALRWASSVKVGFLPSHKLHWTNHGFKWVQLNWLRAWNLCHVKQAHWNKHG